MAIYEVFNSVQEALDAGRMYGVDVLPISNEAIRLLKNGKVLKCSDHLEYVQIIAMEGTDIDAEAVIIDGRA